jgi:hypothetical protein
MTMRYVPALPILAAFTVALLSLPAHSRAEEKMEGKVVRTSLTLCNPQPTGGGCEGTVILETSSGGQDQRISFKVTFDTKIRKGQDYTVLPATRGSSVVVSYITEKGEKVAKSIEVIGAAR